MFLFLMVMLLHILQAWNTISTHLRAYQEVQDMPKVQAFTESPAWPSRRGKLHSAGCRVSSRQSKFVFACAGQWKKISKMLDSSSAYMAQDAFECTY